MDVQGDAGDAVHAALDGAVTYGGDPVRHYDEPPETASYPYMTTVTSSMNPTRVKTSTGYGGSQTVEVQVSVWSTERNRTEVAQIKSDLLGVVRNASFSLPAGMKVLRARILDAGRILRDPGPQVNYQGITEIELRIQLPPL